MNVKRTLAWLLVTAIQVVVPMAIVVVGLYGAYTLITTRPEVAKSQREANATYVEVFEAEATDHRIQVVAYGTTQAHRALTLQPEVGGRVIELNPSLTQGGIIREGEILLKIDPRNYEAIVEEHAAALTRAEFDLSVEAGRQAVALREWELLESSVESSAMGRSLALREPHLKEKKSAVKAAQSRLDKANIDLDRTTLFAPFNCIVLDEAVEVGQLINAQASVSMLACTDLYHVVVNVPRSRLNWIAIPGVSGTKGADANIFQELGDRQRLERNGSVVRLLGDVDPNGRMARVQIAIDDPLELNRTTGEREPMLIGEYVRVEIQGPWLRDVIRVPRGAIHDGDRIRIMNADSRLEVRDVEIAFGTTTDVFLTSGVLPGERIVGSPLPVAIPDMLLVTNSADAPIEPTGDATARTQP